MLALHLHRADGLFVQGVDGGIDADRLHEAVLDVLQEADGGDAEVELGLLPAPRLHGGVDEEVKPWPAVFAKVDVIVAEEGDVAAAREVLDTDDAVRLAILGHAFAIAGDDAAEGELPALEALPLAAADVFHRHVADVVEDDAILVEWVGGEVLLTIEALQWAPGLELGHFGVGDLHSVVGTEEGVGGRLLIELKLGAVAKQDIDEGFPPVVFCEEGFAIDAEAVEGARERHGFERLLVAR